MSASERLLRITATAVATLWLASFLGWRALDRERETRVAAAETTPSEPVEIEVEPEPPEAAPPEPEEVAELADPPSETGPLEPAESEATPRPAEEAPTPEAPPARTADAGPEPEPARDPDADEASRSVSPREPERARTAARTLPSGAARDAPATSSAAEPEEPLRLAAPDWALGDEVLEGSRAFPALSATYERFGDFDAYARAMLDLGARFVVVRDRRIVGGIDPWTAAVAPLTGDLAFSPRARDYSDEPGLTLASRSAERRFGEGSEVMMLVPRRLDAGLFGGIAKALAELGEEASDFREVRARYERGDGGEIRLRVESATRLDGTRVPIGRLFELATMAQGGGRTAQRPSSPGRAAGRTAPSTAESGPRSELPGEPARRRT